jgi:hypothetical protein
MSRLVVFGLVASCVATSACSSSKPQTVPPPALSRPNPTTCATTTPTTDSTTWQLVSADQFTFCIPKDWVVLGKQAKLGSAVVRWGNTDELERVEFARGTVRVPGGYGKEPPSSSTVPRIPGMEGKLSSENIGGRDALITQTHVSGTVSKSAAWSRPSVFVRAQSESDGDAALLLVIIRSVRFP